MAHSAFLQARNNLLAFIKQQKLAGNKLPSEEELADLLKVSRGTVREILRSLNREGLVSTKHGYGNFIHASALNAKMRIDQLHDFFSLIKDGGYDVAVKVITAGTHIVSNDDSLSKPLCLKENEKVFYLECLYYADAKPAIFCKMLIPQNICLHEPGREESARSVYEFVKINCVQEIEHTLIWFKPIVADEALAGCLQIPVGSPLMAWEEVYYNFFDEPICTSTSFFQPELMKVCMLRK